jgi:hypothetical protein
MTHPVTAWIKEGMEKEASVGAVLSSLSDDQVGTIYETFVEKRAGVAPRTLAKAREVGQRVHNAAKAISRDPLLEESFQRRRFYPSALSMGGKLLGAGAGAGVMASKGAILGGLGVAAAPAVAPAAATVGTLAGLLGMYKGQKWGINAALRGARKDVLKHHEWVRKQPLGVQAAEAAKSARQRSGAAYDALLRDPKAAEKLTSSMAREGVQGDLLGTAVSAPVAIGAAAALAAPGARMGMEYGLQGASALTRPLFEAGSISGYRALAATGAGGYLGHYAGKGLGIAAGAAPPLAIGGHIGGALGRKAAYRKALRSTK